MGYFMVKEYILLLVMDNYVDEYKIGNLWNGIMKEKDGTIDYKVVNWKKIKQ